MSMSAIVQKMDVPDRKLLLTYLVEYVLRKGYTGETLDAVVDEVVPDLENLFPHNDILTNEDEGFPSMNEEEWSELVWNIAEKLGY